jgi:hypothetical protein
MSIFYLSDYAKLLHPNKTAEEEPDPVQRAAFNRESR